MYDAEENRIGCQQQMKALGLVFGSAPTMNLQVKRIKKGVRQRYWTLRNLKRNGFTVPELLKVYTTMIRPVAKYDAPVFHSSLTDEQDEAIERLQNHALKCIYGPGKSGRKMRKLSGLPTLRARREEICDKFAAKCVGHPRLEEWFPKKTARASRRGTNREEFLETKARCKRLFDSPLFYFRRRLNGKIRKSYGKRNEEYRT